MKILVSGGYGYVGNFIAQYFHEIGHDVIIGARAPQRANPFVHRQLRLDPDIDQSDVFKEVDVFIHAAFDHIKGKYRNGEGDDPIGFVRKNLDGSVALFQQAKQVGIKHTIFLSSRAVYGTQPPGTDLFEHMECHPDTLYGEVKLKAEQELARLSSELFKTTSLRVTGVFGVPIRPDDQCFGLNIGDADFIHHHVAHILAHPESPHKWTELFAEYLAGKTIPPRAGTEIHGTDLAQAIDTILSRQASSSEIYNLSQIMLDRHDLLKDLAQQTGVKHTLPERANITNYNQMNTDKIDKLIGPHPETD